MSVPTGRPDARAGSGFARHFEGWQPGLLAVFLAGSSAAVAVPRPVAPIDLPEPDVAPRVAYAAARADDELSRAAEARRPELPFDVRMLGSALRAYGTADAGQDDAAVMAERKRVADEAKRARTQGNQALAMLRAFELTSFLHELRRWEATGVETDALRELGGPFVTMATRNGWVSGHGLVMDDTVRRAMFKKRWNELVQVRGAPFDLAAVEERALLRFFLRAPPRDPSSGADERAAYFEAQFRLKKIDELAAVDPSYPADLARGVINFSMRRYPVAAGLFRRHLEAHPDGAHTLRAQNYLDAALARAGD